MIEIKLGQKSNLSGAVILGYFDCVHIGHCALISEGKKDNDAYCFTFNTDISAHLPKKSPNVYSYEERLIRFQEEGVKGVIYSPFNQQIMEMEAQDFLDEICKTVNVEKVVCGKDFRFGKKGKGNVQTLQEYFLDKGIKTVVVNDVVIDGKKVSTGMVNERLKMGELEIANAILGRNYSKLCKVNGVDKECEKSELSAISGNFGLKDGKYVGVFMDKEVNITLFNNVAYVDKTIKQNSGNIVLTFIKRG